MSSNYLIIFFSLLFTSLASAQIDQTSLQRYRFVGSSKDGLRAAILLSGFGPASLSPSARLIVKQAGNSQPLLNEMRWRMDGEELELKQLETALLEASAPKLKSLGISTDPLPVEETAQWAASGTSGISGTFETHRDKRSAAFHLTWSDDRTCPKENPGVFWQLCVAGACQAATPNLGWFCGVKEISLRNLYRTASGLWFVVYGKRLLFGDLAAYDIDFDGVKLD